MRKQFRLVYSDIFKQKHLRCITIQLEYKYTDSGNTPKYNFPFFHKYSGLFGRRNNKLWCAYFRQCGRYLIAHNIHHVAGKFVTNSSLCLDRIACELKSWNFGPLSSATIIANLTLGTPHKSRQTAPHNGIFQINSFFPNQNMS